MPVSQRHPGDEGGERLRREEIQTVVSATPWSATLNLVNGGILASAQRDAVEPAALFGWIAVLVFSVLARASVWLCLRRPQGTDGTARIRGAIVCAAALSGLVWGSAAILFLPTVSPVSLPVEHPLLLQALTISFVAGMAAGALASFGTIAPAYRAYALCTLGPPAIAFALVPSELRLLIAATLLIYLSFLLYSGRRQHRQFAEAFATGYENESLVRQLTRENDRVEALNGEIARARETLELRVAQRTAELSRAVEELEREIAERKALETRLVQAQKMEAVGQLTGGVAHDFNNLLTVVLGNLELLEERCDLGPEARRYVARGTEATRRGAALTERLLAFSRRQPLTPETIRLDVLVDGMTDLLKRSLGETVSIVTEKAPGLWPVDIDPAQLENALLNLAINARDAMPDGGTLRLAMKNATVAAPVPVREDTLVPGEYVVFTVSDTGCGIPAEVLPRIVEPFFTTKQTGKGSGLGLSMVYGFVRQSGGFIDIASTPGDGTSVTLYLPRARTG